MSLKYASRWKLVIYTFLSVISALGNIVIAYVTKIMLNFAQYRNGSIHELVNISLLGGGAIILIMFSNFGYRYIKFDIVKDINMYLKEKSMRYWIFKRSESNKNGLSMMTNDLKQIESLKILNELLIISEAIAFIISFIVGIINSWILTIVFLVTTFIPGLVQKFFTQRLKKASDQWEKENVAYTQNVNDGLNSGLVVNLYDSQNVVLQKVVQSAHRLENALKSLNVTQGVANEIILAIADICSFIIPFLIGAILMFKGQIGAGTLVMIVQLSNEFINPVVAIFQQINAIKSTDPIWDKMQPALKFTPQNTTTQTNQVKAEELKLKNVSYQRSGKTILSNISFTVKPGEKILLMAPSGWGKTTLLQIISGQIHPDTGEIYYGEKNITGNWEKAHKLFEYINQKPFIFDDTLKFNIVLGREVSSKELEKAVEFAGLTELVQEKGWDYEVGEKGINLSGGQIQRIEIARALLAKRPVILADEATSSLDQNLSRKIRNVLLQETDSSLIEVAHKISEEEKSKFDQVITFEN